MTTNGLLITQEMLSVCNKYGLTSFQITLDGLKEQHDKVRFISENRGSFDKIVENIILAIKNKIHVGVRINCSESTMANLNDILKSFDDLDSTDRQYINFDLQKVWQEQVNIDDSMSESRFYFKDQGYHVQGQIGDTVIGSCYADKRYQATINYNGEVFKCTARDFKDNSGEGMLQNDGAIIWNEKYEKRLNSKFKNLPCKECRILPICGGGCTQQALENEGRDYCVMNFDEEAKTQLIINKFKSLVN